MKKTLFAVSLFTALLIITACGGGDKKNDKKNESSAKVSAEMQGFMDKLDGKSASVSAALDQYGTDSLQRNDMDMYDLKDPKVLETNGNCHLIQCKSGMTKRKYNVCWEGGKISSIEDKGME